ncbi:3'-5' exoribonuclease [Salmonella enterica subsp. enterica serovar Bareilly]
MSTKPLFLLRKAKKSSGEPDVVLWASDDFESTCATLDYLIVKSGKKLSSYFKAVATNFPVVNDLPPEGEIDFTWSERYQLSKDSMTWELKPGAAPDDVHHQDNAQETEELTGGQEENTLADAHEDCQDCEVSVATLPFPQRVLHIFTYAAADKKYLHHATRAQRRHITVLEMEQENSYIQNLLMVLRKSEQVEKLDNATLFRLTEAIKTVFSVTQNHQPWEFENFVTAWLNAEHPDRGLLVKEWQKGNRVSRITRTASGANAGGGNKTDRNPDLVHTLDTLDVEIAAATLPMDFNIYEIPGSVYRRAKEVVRKKESPFREWSPALRSIPGILDYSRAAIFALIRGAEENIHLFPDALRRYINTNLTEINHENPTAETLAAARHTPEKDAAEEFNRQLAAARGEYVEGISAPNDPKWVHNDYSASNQDETADDKGQEKACNTCGKTGRGNCPDCGTVMGDATYKETFGVEKSDDCQEKDQDIPEKDDSPQQTNNEDAQHGNSANETDHTSNTIDKVNGHHEKESTSQTWTHLMVDLETMGENQDAPIVAIAAVLFDPQTGKIGAIFYAVISLVDAMKSGAVPDGETIEWWLQQSGEARSALLVDQRLLVDALLQLREFINEHSDEKLIQVWGNGATFDNVILRRSYERLGIPCPWRFYNDRDIRTIVELGKAIGYDARNDIAFEGERHNALDDARHQAKYVSAIWQKLIPNQADF